jgi:hypothetical protein
MSKIDLILWILAAVFFAMTTFSVPSHPRFAWIGAGLFCAPLTVFV